MELSISYGVVFGKCDASDRIDYDTVELSDEEAKAVMLEALTGDWDEILEYPELKETYDNLYSEIEDMEIENNLDMEDEYTMECQGTIPMDEDELNDLVHEKDPHALEFFGLQDADDEEIEEWDASDLDEIPTVAEFTPGFEPESPYDCGWDLNLFVDDVEIDEDELINFLKSLFSENQLDDIKSIASDCLVEFDRDIEEIILEVAKDMNCQEYIDSVSKDE